jgi:membrane-associated phospholipid phosphatase
MFVTHRLFTFRRMLLPISLYAVMGTLGASSVRAAVPDPVLQWIGIMNDTVLAGKTNPLVTTRVTALVTASMFDAVNGIHPIYHWLYVRPNAPGHASQRAAAVQAAYVILSTVYPDQSASLTIMQGDSMAAISATESPKSVQAGTAWGQTVATAILAMRASDGFTPPPPPFVGVLGMTASPAAVGVWRPTPLVNATGAGPQFATMTPWVLLRPSQFRLPPPNDVSSPKYVADYKEIKSMGVFSGSGRSADESEFALFWAGNTALFWNRIASKLSVERSLRLSENARLFALLNVTMADAAIACWDSKYRYVFWRPITAIRLGGSDGNPMTDPDPAWTPWLDSLPSGTPAHPEYPSGHSTVSGSAAYVLAAAFGDNSPFTVTSEVRPGTTRSFGSFSAAVKEIANARVFGGIHFRISCVRGNELGQSVAAYISSHVMRVLDE